MDSRGELDTNLIPTLLDVDIDMYVIKHKELIDELPPVQELKPNAISKNKAKRIRKKVEENG